MRNTLIPVFIPHLGCPCACVFCNQKEITSCAPPTPQEVAGQIEEALAKTKDPQIAFYGGSFTALEPGRQEAYLGAAAPFLKDGRCESIRVSTRPDAIDGQTAERLKRYGVKTVELGAQSMQDEVLLASRRGHTARQTQEAARLLKQAGFEVILQMMAGLPLDSREKCRRTAQALCALQPDGVRIYPVCVLQDTALYESMRRGEYQPLSVEEAAEWCADALECFEKAGIPVIRIGLNPTEELSGGAVAAGAYHPAMGEIVRSRLMRRKADELIAAREESALLLMVPQGRLSLLRGQKNSNMVYFAARWPDKKLTVREEPGQSEALRCTGR